MKKQTVRILLSISLAFLLSSLAFAQDEESKVDYPEADIFLFELVQLKNGSFSVVKGRNATNRPGYENQPFFTSDSKSFLFSQSDDGQTDVFEYFLATQKATRVTASPNMEFSPTPSPDNKTISFVTDGEGANQSIWHISRDDTSNPKWTLKNQPEREPVGYYSWNHESGFILFWSRYGYAMRLVHESKKQSDYICGNAIPTTPWIIPGTNKFSFVHRQGNEEVWIKELNPKTRSVRPLVAISGNNHHYNWAPDGSILQIQGTKLMSWKESSGPLNKSWVEVSDLAKFGVASASRIAISPDGRWLAVVGLPSKPK